MKKILITASVLVFAASAAVLAEETAAPQAPVNSSVQYNRQQRPPKGPDFEKRNAEFEKRLKLSDKQKTKVQNLREQSMEQMKPLMDKMKEKRNELEDVKLSKIITQAQRERIDQLNKDIGVLNSEVHKLRMQNMKDFESILSRKQKKELKKMKEEGRKNFDKEFRNHKRPNFEQRPDGGFPPPPMGR